MITPQIKVEKDGEYFEIFARDTFYAHLIFQEVEYWYNFSDTYNIDEFLFVVDRRGFSKEEIEILKNLCLFSGLKNIW